MIRKKLWGIILMIVIVTQGSQKDQVIHTSGSRQFDRCVDTKVDTPETECDSPMQNNIRVRDAEINCLENHSSSYPKSLGERGKFYAALLTPKAN